MKIAVLGNGAWGATLAQLLLDNGQQVALWGREPELSADINKNHRLTRYFPASVELREDLSSTTELPEAVAGAEALLFAVPTVAIRSVAEAVKPLLRAKVHVITTAKGFELGTHKRMSEVLREVLPAAVRYPIVSLIGPSHAEEVVRRQLTAITATSLDQNEAALVQKLFSNLYFRVYTNSDEIGAEYSVAIKNTIAIASGILKGQGYGDNARAALITRGLAEMARLGVKKGGEFATYLGLTGLGDLVVTCNSVHSRNFQAGVAIGEADGAAEFLRTNLTTVEGIRTAKSVVEMAAELQIEMPIANAVYQVLYENRRPSELINDLMGRPLKKE